LVDDQPHAITWTDLAEAEDRLQMPVFGPIAPLAERPESCFDETVFYLFTEMLAAHTTNDVHAPMAEHP
jgi:hypothetical protein